MPIVTYTQRYLYPASQTRGSQIGHDTKGAHHTDIAMLAEPDGVHNHHFKGSSCTPSPCLATGTLSSYTVKAPPVYEEKHL